MKDKLILFLNPFVKIAGLQALLWGVAGMIISVVISYYSQYHYHGLLHFGPAADNTFLRFVLEHLIVWLLPALLFYIGGLVSSKSKIRVIDVFGTVAFAQLPFIIMNLISLSAPMQRLNNMDTNLPLNEIIIMFQQPEYLISIGVAAFSFIFILWVLVWMFGALKISTNLKGYVLVIVYCIGIFGGDILCRIINSLL